MKTAKVIRHASILVISLFMIHTTLICLDGLNDHLFRADVAVIPGNKVESDGTISDRLRSRVDRGLELYQEGWVDFLLVSGGTGKEGYDESRAMADYLLQQGVPDSVIIRDSLGNNTMLTAQNTRKIMDDRNFRSAIIVTHYYHISRTRLALWGAGVHDIGNAAAHANPEWRDPYSIFREFAGFYVYGVKVLIHSTT